MNYPTKKQIREAAKSSHEAKKALEVLFPEVFDHPIHKGEIYEWGTDSDGGSGLVIELDFQLAFINFRTGDTYLSFIKRGSTKFDLNYHLSQLPATALHNCYKGEIYGPKHFKSWCLK